MDIERGKCLRVCQAKPYNNEFPLRRATKLSLEDELFEQRAARVREIEALGFAAFGKRFDFTSTVPDVLRNYGDKTAEQLEPSSSGERARATIAGRVQTIRRMGKAGFMHIQQNGARLQCYVRRD